MPYGGSSEEQANLSMCAILFEVWVEKNWQNQTYRPGNTAFLVTLFFQSHGFHSSSCFIYEYYFLNLFLIGLGEYSGMIYTS